MSAAASRPAAGGGAPLRLRVRRGLDLPLEGAPEATVHDGPPVSAVAVLGDDAPGVRAELRVEPGERVRLGQTLFVDRHRPAVRFVSPGAGVVGSIARGARRRLEAVIVHLEGDEEERFDVPSDPDAPSSGDAVRALLLASGLWTALRTRPFSRIPDPEASPHALFVTAMETDPLAPPAEACIRPRADDFARGLAALATLTEGPVYVCARPDAGLPPPAAPRVRAVGVEGPHPAGLPGTHVHLLAPASAERPSWHVAWPEVLALGRLLATGRLPVERVIALAGPSLAHPRLLRTRLGASTEDLLVGELRDGAQRVVSGPVLSGRQAADQGAFLGRLHTQLAVLPRFRPGRRSWLLPGRRGRARAVPGAGRRAGFDVSLRGRRGAFYPLERLERVWPFDLPLAPLLRALVTGDVEGARELGVLELAEEDLALVTFLCPGKIEYGLLLRSMLDEIERQGP